MIMHVLYVGYVCNTRRPIDRKISNLEHASVKKIMSIIYIYIYKHT